MNGSKAFGKILVPLDFVPFPAIPREPSGILHLGETLYLALEDEKTHPLDLLKLKNDGTFDAQAILPQDQFALGGKGEELRELNDLEGAARDGKDRIHLITSHSRNSQGLERKSRGKLVRFKLDGIHLKKPKVVLDLKEQLCDRYGILKKAAAVLDVKNQEGFNIEGMTWDPEGKRLLVGFRSPLAGKRALVAAIKNPKGIFKGKKADFGGKLIELDLDGNGVRAICYVEQAKGYFLIGGPVARETTPFRLWFWKGKRGKKPREVRVDRVAGFRHAEGIAPATLHGRDYLIIVSDDGDSIAQTPGHYLLVELKRLVY